MGYVDSFGVAEPFGVVPLKREGHTVKIDSGYVRREGEEPEFYIEEEAKPLDSTTFRAVE